MFLPACSLLWIWMQSSPVNLRMIENHHFSSSLYYKFSINLSVIILHTVCRRSSSVVCNKPRLIWFKHTVIVFYSFGESTQETLVFINLFFFTRSTGLTDTHEEPNGTDCCGHVHVWSKNSIFLKSIIN